ncbi:DUF4355 domain-containing protein [Lysinibacillus sphaericus]|uniref:DUF4355 domain-containing protein n=1 Tax=Lysinibacillus sphaericus TaxID=1421 RepID=UPI00248ABAFB|nr:DUF4355 domain-containing protein [Lysinibacillus sphaericus]
MSKRYPPELEEAKQLRDLKAQFEQSQKEAAREKLVNPALSTATEKSLPSKLVGFFVGDDAEKTTTNPNAYGREGAAIRRNNRVDGLEWLEVLTDVAQHMKIYDIDLIMSWTPNVQSF